MMLAVLIHGGSNVSHIKLCWVTYVCVSESNEEAKQSRWRAEVDAASGEELSTSSVCPKQRRGFGGV